MSVFLLMFLYLASNMYSVPHSLGSPLCRSPRCIAVHVIIHMYNYVHACFLACNKLVGVASICQERLHHGPLAAPLGWLPTPVGQEGWESQVSFTLCIERLLCSFAALCFVSP